MKQQFITGNFALDIEGELNEAKREEALANGLRYIIQRDVASKAYKTLFGENKDAKRKDVEFSEESAGTVEKAFTDAMAPYGQFNVRVSKHEAGEGAASPMVRATAFVDSLMDNGDKEAQLRGTLALFDPTAVDADRDGLIAIAHKQGLGIQPPKAAKA